MTSHFHALLPDVLDFILDAIFLIDSQGKIVHVTDACHAILGYRPDELIGRELVEFQVPEDRPATAEEVGRILSGQQRVGFENRYIHKNGHYVDIMWSARWLPEHGLRIGVARDVSRRRQAELRQQATFAISEAAHDAADLSDLCQRLHRILGRLVPVALLAVVIGEPSKDDARVIYETGNLLPDECPRQWYRELEQAGEVAKVTALPLTRHDSMMGAIFMRGAAEISYGEPDHELLRFVAGQVAVAIERKQLHESLLRAAQYDELTGLPNRRLFHDRLTVALARSRRNNAGLGLLFADVDGFKQVNDSLGHAAGDALLQEIGKRLTRCMRASDTVARLSGDEFVVMIEDLATRRDVQLMGEKLREAVSAPIVVAGCTLQVGLSVGIAVFPDDAGHAEQLLSHADSAMYRAKQSRKFPEFAVL